MRDDRAGRGGTRDLVRLEELHLGDVHAAPGHRRSHDAPLEEVLVPGVAADPVEAVVEAGREDDEVEALAAGREGPELVPVGEDLLHGLQPHLRHRLLVHQLAQRRPHARPVRLAQLPTLIGKGPAKFIPAYRRPQGPG